jgi:acyl dehydratase
MATRELNRSPRILPLYLRTAATLLPGASHLPGVPGGGESIPALELTLAGVAIETGRLAAYREVCGFGASHAVPCTYPHVLAFPLHMALMAEPQFPFTAVGLVHVRNEISQLRPLHEGETLSFSVSASEPEPHPRGRTFALITTAHVGSELVWSERSTMLRRERSPERAPQGADEAPQSAASEPADDEPTALSRQTSTVLASERWTVPGDIGRRYGSVSGDRNPIHMHALGGKAFGFPRAIAHGMWTKARCLAALEGELPEAFAVDVRFRSPVSIPGSVSFECDRHDHELRFALRNPTHEELHLAGELRAGAQQQLSAEAGR